MITITCPWCDEDELYAWLELVAPDATFTCAECGTTICFAEAAEPALDLAA